MHLCLVVGSQQLGHSSSLNCILVCHQSMTPTQLPKIQKQCNGILSTPTVDHKNKQENDVFMDVVYVVGVIAILHQILEVIVNIVSKENNS